MRTRPKAQCDQQRNGTRVCECMLVCVCVCVPPFWLTLSCLVRRVVVVVANAATAAHIHTHTHARMFCEKVRVWCECLLQFINSIKCITAHSLSVSLFHSTHHADTNTLKWRAQSNWKLSHSRLSFWFALPPPPSPNDQFIQVQLQLKYVYNFLFYFIFSSTNFTLHLSGTKTDLSRVPCQAVKLIAWIRLLLLLLLLAKWAPGLPTH